MLLVCCSPTDPIAENTPQNDELTRLLKGNDQFRLDESKEKISSLQHRQLPFAVVITCSDSRVSPELIFHQGLGELFVIRTAGNIIGEYELGSIEYAIESFHTKLIIVLGHENCGALTAYVKHDHKLRGHIETIVDYIEREEEELNLSVEDRHNIKLATNANILHAVNLLKKSEPILTEHIRDKQLKIIGALYHLSDGHVEIISEDPKF